MTLARMWQVDPWRELDRIHDEMNRLFRDTFSRVAVRRYPAINMWVKDDQAIVTAELPGFDPDKLEITVLNDELHIKGERKLPEPEKDVTFHRKEIDVDSFQRTISLPYAVENDKVEANFEKGVLTIVLPRAEADKPRKIQVKSK
ncbi:heat shock protein Hsp20 [Caldithrix abyssi DSM 13497]|uniref:HSP20 family protein n=1 Tax=Caldithrix abyssi DSM 13497 TaxID=880073 RepID=H1XYV1_CALAY|nr:Hsp20/alpha crystallin family protein [Caldithrix abyssi]APF20508.1 HSP20 family protein [Caldithrix abyssi DSM 13497]EHO40970.1 heat shock protein Hsp20 [Caldithrix abyssi DSM 13497]